MKPVDIVRYIVWYATERDITLTTIRLVKFVYLADLYYARRTGGTTLTGFPWAFVYYGPYCGEVMGAIDNAARGGTISRQTYESRHGDNKEYHVFMCRDVEAGRLEDQIPLPVVSPLKSAIRKYGDDTASLLDHVYFETEPMMDQVVKGDVLDFSKARPVQIDKPIQLKKLSKAKIARAREHLDNLSRKMSEDRRRLAEVNTKAERFMDDVYFRALEQMDGEDLGPGLEGTARIVPE